MIKDRDFLVFSDDWGRHPFSCQHIMQHFLPCNRVLWVNTIGMRLPRLCLYDVKRAAGKISSWTSNPPQESLPDNLRVVSPVMVPFSNVYPVRNFNKWSVVRSVKKAMAEWGMHDPIFFATVPNASEYIGYFDECLVSYYCVDDFTVWPGMNLPDLVMEFEKRLLEEADIVMAVSDELYSTKKSVNNSTLLLTHGVDVDHFFTKTVKRQRVLSLADIPGPIIGFYGLIDSHLDLEIIRMLLDWRLDWTVVLIGTKRIDLGTLESRPNFRWLPAVPYEDLPQYASAFDVAIIPYVVNQHTNTANPLKLREYLATGKPVVTTAMAEVFRFKEHLRIAASPEDFASEVDKALSDVVDPVARLACLKGDAWTDKAQMVSDWIEEALLTKSQAGLGVK
ncbi:MAG: glycosyltransferase family 1 protein [Deltaproteobacteria bacterium HGW-Deltaproteobacteria-18]|nr:MAG: glycosyltransferase family 1 protein [Deltaproteobacteria bacterium HGW-Deltaproteobacteria-18]